MEEARDVTTSARKDSTRKKENSVGFFFLPFPVVDEPKTKGSVTNLKYGVSQTVAVTVVHSS